jgi:uracil phosphoribosyltransferase
MEAIVTDLSGSSSILNTYVKELRDHVIQKDRLRFRTNLERLAEILAYEISKELSYENVATETPLGETECQVLSEQPVLCSILRAALPMHDGFLRIFDSADNAFISAYRKHNLDDDEFVVPVGYLASPDLTNRTIILMDPMIATGKSLVKVYNELTDRYDTGKVFIASIIVSEEGLEYVRSQIKGARIFTCAIDDELTASYYIVPGLGDAGDLAFGSKH